MKQVFRCDYCNFMDTEEKVKEHEASCLYNYNRKSCSTCKHVSIKSITQFKCACGEEIPENCMIENCEKHEFKDRAHYDVSNIFGSPFKGWF